MKNEKLATIARTAVLAGLLALAGAAQAQDKPVELKMSHWVPPTHPTHKTALAWAQSVEKASGGTIKVAVFPAQQLGKAFDHYDMAAKGIADMAFVNVGYQAGRHVVASMIQLPFMVANADGGSRAFDEWYRGYAERDMPGVRMCMAFVHDPGTLHSRTRISSPDQIRGMKIRPAQSGVAEWMRALGATNVTVSAPEAREALERGVADALTFPWESVYLFGLDKVTRFHIDAKMYVTGFAWLMNPAKYATMSPAQKKVIDDHCNGEWAQRNGREWGEVEAGGRAKTLSSSMHTVVQLSPAEMDAWRKSATPVVGAWSEEARKAGHDPQALIDEFQRVLAKHGARL